jgi:nicotinamide riboside transporter PnuC
MPLRDNPKTAKVIIEAAALLTTVIAIAGVIFNNYKVSACFKLWIASNLLSAIIHVVTGPWTFVIRDLIFLALAIQGAYLWH